MCLSSKLGLSNFLPQVSHGSSLLAWYLGFFSFFSKSSSSSTASISRYSSSVVFDLLVTSKLRSLLGEWLPVDPMQSLSVLMELNVRSMGFSCCLMLSRYLYNIKFLKCCSAGGRGPWTIGGYAMARRGLY